MIRLHLGIGDDEFDEPSEIAPFTQDIAAVGEPLEISAADTDLLAQIQNASQVSAHRILLFFFSSYCGFLIFLLNFYCYVPFTVTIPFFPIYKKRKIHNLIFNN